MKYAFEERASIRLEPGKRYDVRWVGCQRFVRIEVVSWWGTMGGSDPKMPHLFEYFRCRMSDGVSIGNRTGAMVETIKELREVS